MVQLSSLVIISLATLLSTGYARRCRVYNSYDPEIDVGLILELDAIHSDQDNSVASSILTLDSPMLDLDVANTKLDLKFEFVAKLIDESGEVMDDNWGDFGLHKIVVTTVGSTSTKFSLVKCHLILQDHETCVSPTPIAQCVLTRADGLPVLDATDSFLIEYNGSEGMTGQNGENTLKVKFNVTGEKANVGVCPAYDDYDPIVSVGLITDIEFENFDVGNPQSKATLFFDNTDFNLGIANKKLDFRLEFVFELRTNEGELIDDIDGTFGVKWIDVIPGDSSAGKFNSVECDVTMDSFQTCHGPTLATDCRLTRIPGSGDLVSTDSFVIFFIGQDGMNGENNDNVIRAKVNITGIDFSGKICTNDNASSDKIIIF